MHRRILGISCAFLLLASAVSAAPHQGSERSGIGSWIETMFSTVVGMAEAVLSGDEGMEAGEPGQALEPDSSPPKEFGSGPEPSGGYSAGEFGGGPEPNG